MKEVKNSCKVIMKNPENNVKIVTALKFKSQWEKLGFVTVSNISLLKKVS